MILALSLAAYSETARATNTAPALPGTSSTVAQLASSTLTCHKKGKYGLAPGVKPPTWAEHTFVHFMPGVRGSTSLSSMSAPCKQASPFSAPLAAYTLVAGTRGERLVYRGGPVQHAPQLYLLWWGSNWEQTVRGREARTALYMFFHNLEAENDIPKITSSWQGIISQYHDLIRYEGAYHHAVVVAEGKITSVGAPREMSMSMLEETVTSWIAQLISENRTPSKEAQIVVLPAPYTEYTSEVLPKTIENGREYVTCGWHSEI